MQTNTTSPQLRKLVLALGAAALMTTGCANLSEAQKGTAVGAGVGALGGAAIGRNAAGTAIGAGVGALGGYVWSQYMQQKKANMEQATAGTGVMVTQTPDNQLKVNIPSDISFDTGSATIKPDMRPILDQFAAGLGNQQNTEIRIVGHTDNTGSAAINDPLSVQRAASVRDYVSARGVNPQRVVISGGGEREPIADNGSAQGRAQNRRVEIFLAEKAVAQGPVAAPPVGGMQPVGTQPVGRSY